MLKDMRLSQQTATAGGAATPLAGATASIYQMLVAAGFGEYDFSYVFNLLSGRILRRPGPAAPPDTKHVMLAVE